jgi:ADP-ribosyl-[dinitrogen reductase] hydrolase
MTRATSTVDARIAGGLLGLAAGDALGATLEFLPAAEVRRRYQVHREIIGGGWVGWRAGQGTDDTDLAYAVAHAYAGGYSLDRVGEAFLAWLRSSPRDIGATTRAALRELARTGDPRTSGQAVLHEHAAGNGALMRALPTGLAQSDPTCRRRDATEIAAITHADPRCTQASVAYCDLADALLEGANPTQAVAQVLATSPVNGQVRDVIAAAARSWSTAASRTLRPTGYVLDTLQVAVWAVLQRNPLEDVLIQVVNLGGDADTTGAVAGGLLGVRDGVAAIPTRWLDRLEYRERLQALVPSLAAQRRRGQRSGSRPPHGPAPAMGHPRGQASQQP